MKRLVVILIGLLAVSSCATYYQSNLFFNQEFERGNLDEAYKTIQKESSQSRSRRILLYYFNCGLVLSMMGRYEESNTYFEKAYLYGEDYRINYLNEVASYLTNPMVTSYRGEDHEHLLVLYYKAMNYLKMHNTDDALVECRRLNTRLQQLSDRYQSKEKYERDAFVNLLMGIIYEADKDYNNAFIAYRNALTIYQSDYARLFGVTVPAQLRTDILRTAWLSGLTNEFENFKSDFQMADYVYKPTDGGELVFFWHNGLAPVKVEWGVDFVVSQQGNWVYFANEQLGYNFPFQVNDNTQRNALTGLQIIRIAFPKYMERKTYFIEASVDVNNNTYPLQLAEDVNKIAFKCLQERMGIEFSKALLRVAVKKTEENQIRKENETLGAIVGLLNAVTEKADTRNWQTLPHSISYCRISLPEGNANLHFVAQTPGGREVDHPITVSILKGQTTFHTFTSLETAYTGYNSQY
ncbi:MAG: hypothetical protein JST69_13320 [Bacteroidetes bacterium]|nr:hypothetical protein [Bacteroidota bacterium]